MTNAELEKLKKQIEEAQAAVAAEEERRKKAAELGVSAVEIDTSKIESQLDLIISDSHQSVALLVRLNQVSDQIYAKLEKISLDLLQLMQLGMPLLEKANKGA